MFFGFFLFFVFSLVYAVPMEPRTPRKTEIRLISKEENIPMSITYHDEDHVAKFRRSDEDDNDELTFGEFLHMELAYVLAKREEFLSLDKNNDNKISKKEYEEHYHGVNSKSAAIRAQYFATVFDEFDEDMDKSLSIDEMLRLLRERFHVVPRENFPSLYQEFDTDNSRGLNLIEYMTFDAHFPFEQTDAAAANQSMKQMNDEKDKQRSADDPLFDADQDADEAAIAAVKAQARSA